MSRTTRLPMLAKTDFVDLIPHAGDMCLLDGVLAWDDTSIHATSVSHVLDTHPLRGEHGLHAVHLAEYGAQAMAVHGALRAREHGETEPRPGMLVSLRGVKVSVQRIDTLPGALDVYAECLIADESGAQYLFRVSHNDEEIASGRAAVIHPSQERSARRGLEKGD